jgi:hypothetical protein
MTKKFWLGVLLGSLLGGVLLAPDSQFSQEVKTLFSSLRNSAGTFFNTAGRGSEDVGEFTSE